MRTCDADFQGNLEIVGQSQAIEITAFTNSPGGAAYGVKNLIKTPCEIFHDAASFHALRQKLVSNRGISVPCPGFFSMQRIRAIVFGFILICLPLMGLA